MPDTPLLDRMDLEKSFGDYKPMALPADLPNVPHTAPDLPMPTIAGEPYISPLTALENSIFSTPDRGGKLMGGSIPRSLAEVTSSRYNNFVPGDYNNEDAYAQGQGWTSKMVNSVGKGLSLTGTTFLQSTVGLVNGVVQWANTGRAASFYDNDFNRNLDEINKKLEDVLPNYYTDAEKNAAWYSYKKLFTANFFWDGIIKNMGFAAGAALSGGVYTAALKALPLTSRLFSIGKAAEALAATEEGLLAADKVAETYGKVKGLSDKFLSSYKTLNKAGRAVVAGLSTTGEAGFEAFHNMNQFRDDKIAEWKELHNGMEPKGQDLAKINSEAENVGNSSFLLNTGLLSVTNYIQFPKILGSTYKAEKGIVNGLTKEIGEVTTDAAGKYAQRAPRFGKVLSTLNKVRPYTFSASEAFEEGAQYAIQVGTQDYYNKKYKGQHTDWLESLVEGAGKTLTTNEGMENVLIGGLSGALMMAKGKIQEGSEKTKNTAEAIAQFNKFKISDFTKETSDAVNRGVAIQEDRETALRQGDVLESKDLEKDYIINYLTPRIKFGRFDLVTSDLQQLRELATSDQGFAQLVGEGKVVPGDTQEAYLKRLTNLESTANNMKSLYQSLNLRYGNSLTKDGKLAYTPEVMDKMLYAATKIADYDQRIPELTSKLISSNIDVATIADEILNGNFDNYNKIMADLEGSKRPDKEDLIEALQDVNELTLRRDKFMDEYDEIKKSPEKYQTKLPENLQNKIDPARKVSTIKTKDGDIDLETGKEYFAGAPMRRSKEGTYFQEFSRFTVLGETPDGKLIIKTISTDPNTPGEVLQVDKTYFEKHQLGDVASLESNPNGKFYVESAGQIFKYNLGGGKFVEGTVRYDRKKDRLTFVSLDGTKKFNITRADFKAKKGFTEGKIVASGQLTARAKAALDEAVSQEEIQSVFDQRDEVLSEVFNNTKNRLEEINKSIEDAKKEMERINESIENLSMTKSGAKRKAFIGAAKKTLNALQAQYKDVENLVANLEAEKEELENVLPYLQEMYDNRDMLPESYSEVVKDLKEEIDQLEEMIDNTNDAIKQGNSLLDSIKGAINTALSLFNDFVKRLGEENPKIPLFMKDFQERLEKYLGEQGAQQFINDRLGFTDIVSDLQDQIESFGDELNLPNMEKRAEKLTAQLIELEKGLNELVNKSIAKGIVMEAFQKAAEEYEKKVEQEKLFVKNTKLIKKFLGTADESVPTEQTDESYEADAKKDDMAVVTSTTVPSAEFSGKDLAPHHQRANQFGANIENLPNRDNIRGVIVTSTNEETILPGLTEFLKTQGDQSIEVDPEQTIALVMVEVDPEDGTVHLIGVDGQRLATQDLNAAIFQTFPLTLTWSNGKSMFRDSSENNVVESLTDQYYKWREETLKNPPKTPFEVSASFGIPEPITYLDDKGVKQPVVGATTSVEEAGLIQSSELLGDPMIKLSTNEEVIENGSTRFEDAIGKVFLSLKNAYVKLKNRKFNKQEATNIYNAIFRVATNMFENEEEGIDSTEAQRMLSYLRSIVYWGTPKDTEGNLKALGYNSVFFDKEDGKGPLKLFISGRGENITLTPSSLRTNKDLIIDLLQNIYNNVNSRMVETDWNEPYEEILSISEDGKVETRDWPNYQSFLLSKTLPDESGGLSGAQRSNDELPLSVEMRPLEGEGDVNRQGIYFTISHPEDKFEIPKEESKKKKVIKGSKLAEEEEEEEEEEETPKKTTKKKAKTSPGKIKFAPEGTVVFDGETINTFTVGKKKIYYIADGDALKNKDLTNGIKIIFTKGDAKSIHEALKDKGLDGAKALFTMKGNIAKEILPKLGTSKTKTKTKTTPFASKKGKADTGEESFVIGDEEDEEDDDTEDSVETAEAVEDVIEDDQDEVVIIDDELQDDLDDMEDDAPFRLAIEERINAFQGENWAKLESWLKANFPNVPVYRVKNIIKATNGRQAWGMLKDGAIYIYENAEVGTAYHEVFEAVWKMFSDSKERRAVLAEFKARKGTFIDRETLREVAYSDATDKEAKEQLAEEFRDYVQEGKIPAKPTEGKPFIVKLFADLVNFIKEFFTGNKAQINTANLFARIGSGYYKQYSPYHSRLSFAKEGIIDIEDAFANDDSEFSIANFTGQEVHDIMQELTYQTLGTIVEKNESLFNVTSKNKKELYDELRLGLRKTVTRGYKAAKALVDAGKVGKKNAASEMAKSLAMRASVMNDDIWNSIVEKHQEYLKKYNIEFDENDEMQLTDDDNSGKSDYQEADKIDHFKKANAAIKLLLSTVPIVEADPTTPGKTSLVRSSIGGVTLLPTIEVFVKILNNTYNSRNVEDMLDRIRKMAKNDIDYRTVYERITRRKVDTPGPINLSNLTKDHDVDLLNALWRSFKKQNPEVKVHYILDNGDIQIGDANLASATNQAKADMVKAIVKKIKGKNDYFVMDKEKNVFRGIKGAASRIRLGSVADRIIFLKTLGINFNSADVVKLSKHKLEVFKKAVNGLRDSISQAQEIATLSGKVLNINKRLTQLAEIKAAIENPEFDSTYFGINGERKQTYIGTNASSDLYDALSQVDNIKDIPKLYPHLAYLLTDSFVQGSVIMRKMFNPVTGDRILGSDELMKPDIVDGTNDQTRGKKKQSSKLTYRDRFIQEINLNLEGYYLNLVPGDASLEWMMNMGNHVTQKQLLSGFGEVNKIFRGYFLSEVNLAREERPTAKNRNTKNLRFFEDILGKELHDEITSQLPEDKKNRLQNRAANKKNSDMSPEELYAAYESKINKALQDFIEEQSESLKITMMLYGIAIETSEGWNVEGLDFENTEGINSSTLMRELNGLTINFMINNIELHKLLYSDPYQYSDELKRIKNFNSPRQAIMSNSKQMNAVMNKVWNKMYTDKKDIGYTDFTRDYFKTATLEDIIGVHNLPGYTDALYKETDGSGIITMKGNRNFRIRSGDWTPLEERQYIYDVAWEKTFKGKDLSQKEKEEKGLILSQEEQQIYDAGNPHVKSAYTPIKPIVSGNKDNGKPYNDVMLDKFALYPLSLRVMMEINKDANAIKLYDKMQKEDIDYVIFESGRKVGADKVNKVYNDETGNFNNAPYEGVFKVPFAIMSVQAEVPSKDSAVVRKATQVTKLITMDFMEAGVPVDFMIDEKDFNKRYKEWYSIQSEEKRLEESKLYKEIKNNESFLKALIEDGFENLLQRFGIKETVDKDGKPAFEIADFKKVVKTLKEEMMKREINDNIISALTGFENGDVVLEATPAYQQIRNVLYSIADQEVISQKISGGMKVQIPSTLMESNRVKAEMIKLKDGKEKLAYTSDVLNFYSLTEDGKTVNVCEIMIGRWFDSDMSDEELLKYLNETKEGQRILSGLGYRIPNQKQNSTDKFVIKKFLPREFGDSVVVPAAFVHKTGSDFDIDKLSMYLKNVFIDKFGKPKMIEFLTDENSTIEQRYKRFIQSKVKEYASIKRDVRESSLEYQQLQEELNNRFDSYKEKLQETKDQIITPYSDRLDAIKTKIEQGQDASQDIFNQGFDIFRELPKSVRQQFFERNRQLDDLIKDETIQSFDKTLYFKAFAQQWKEALKAEGDYQLTYTDKEGKEQVETVSSAGTIKTLNKLMDNYDFYLTSIGWTKETIAEFNDNLTRLKDNVEQYKNLKEGIKIDALITPNKNLIAEFNSLFDRTLAETFNLMSIDEFKTLSIYKQNSRKALENGYIESSEALVSSRENFDQLIKPNSAEQLKDLANEVVDSLNLTKFDYSRAGNMLNRMFMSTLRHAFVTGKYAIGIAAVNQTNHSLNQRQPIYIDLDRMENVSFQDKNWLGDGKLKFFKEDGTDNFNTITVKDKVVTTLSMIKNQAGDFISDIIAQFIDGYVDISKGPWIIQLGATPNVASTFLFLVKAGVPIRSVVYFMNQPIIRDYLRSLENSGYTWVFNDTQMAALLADNKYKVADDIVRSITALPTEDRLKEFLGQQDFNIREKAEQQFVLKEFLKYAKLAEQMFHVTQGSNFDTANFNDPYLVFKKEQQLLKAQGTIISSVDELIENSFLETLRFNITKMRDALSEILKSDKSRVRKVIQSVLTPYVDKSDREFVKIAQKAVADLFDWVVQSDVTTKSKVRLNSYIESALLNDDNYVRQINSFVEKVRNNKKHPLYNNQIIKILEPILSDRVNGVDNLKIKSRDNKVYDQNMIIYGFKELKDHLGADNQELYNKLVTVAVLQSGLSRSPISFTSLLPYEDFKKIYNEVLSKLETIPNLEDFYKLNVFERNNWNDDELVPHSRAKLFQSKSDDWYYNTNMNFLPNDVQYAITKGKIPQVLTMSMFTRDGASDIIVYNWDDESFTINERKEMRRKGDYSFIKKGLFKKVYDEFGEPLIHGADTAFPSYVYQAINAWGDSFRANEFYSTPRKSKIENGFIKVKEVTPSEIIAYFVGRDGRVSKESDIANAGTVISNFAGYVGGFSNAGKGTVAGDAKDKAMRKMADGVIVEVVDKKGQTSSNTSATEVAKNKNLKLETKKEGDKFVIAAAIGNPTPGFAQVMLARNGEIRGPLAEMTKKAIRNANDAGFSFIVGDMPGVDSAFIDYLQEIGATFQIYHAGEKEKDSRIKVTINKFNEEDNENIFKC